MFKTSRKAQGWGIHLKLMDRILLNWQEHERSYKKQRFLPAQRGEGADFLGLWLPKFIYSQQGDSFVDFLIKSRAHDSKICCSKHRGSRGRAEAPLEFLLEPSGFDSAKLMQGLPCPYWNHWKAGIVYSWTAGGWSPQLRHFPLLSLGCLGLGCRRGGMPELWRLLQCHTPGKSILAPKIPFPGHCSAPQRPERDRRSCWEPGEREEGRQVQLPSHYSVH